MKNIKFYAVICTSVMDGRDAYVYRCVLAHSDENGTAEENARKTLQEILDQLREDGYNVGEYIEQDDVDDYQYYYNGGRVEVIQCEF